MHELFLLVGVPELFSWLQLSWQQIDDHRIVVLELHLSG
jgi:hypothetical protein